jgi:hypothetical protein
MFWRNVPPPSSGSKTKPTRKPAGAGGELNLSLDPEDEAVYSSEISGCLTNQKTVLFSHRRQNFKSNKLICPALYSTFFSLFSLFLKTK